MLDVLLLLATVPTITAFGGWVTNWAAVKMIVSPEEFVGIGPLGWQGILPRRSDKFATGIADMATDNLVSARELAKRLDPNELPGAVPQAPKGDLGRLRADHRQRDPHPA
jgi:uncharacterized membrane protein YheB (UPF0754 family)